MIEAAEEKIEDHTEECTQEHLRDQGKEETIKVSYIQGMIQICLNNKVQNIDIYKLDNHIFSNSKISSLKLIELNQNINLMIHHLACIIIFLTIDLISLTNDSTIMSHVETSLIPKHPSHS